MDLTLPFAGARVIAHVGTQILADTTRALTLREATYPPVHYIPIDDVDQSLLATSENLHGGGPRPVRGALLLLLARANAEGATPRASRMAKGRISGLRK